jgi:uncharacterized membrane protein (UPF0127 family)
VLRQRLAPLALVLAIACTTSSSVTPETCPPAGSVSFSGQRTLTVQLAEDDATRARGLMGVTTLGADHGMAFVWDEPTTGSFWMKDTLIPLSIAFVDADGQIVTIREMTPCQTDPCPTNDADAPYTMAIEANAGWFDAHGIGVGELARLERTACP